MKRIRALLMKAALVLVGLAVLYAIKLPPQAPAGAGAAGRPLRVALFVNGSLGDKSFYDSAAGGLKRARAELGMHTRVVEAGSDPTRWEAALGDVAESADFDLIITGGFAMVALVQKIAPAYPDTRFIVFDAAVDPARCACANVHSILFRQNEGAYLAGFLAAHLVSPNPQAPPAVLGVVGGMQIPVIDDFVVGFAAGAQAARPGTRVLRQYVNSFTDPATAKEVAKAMFGQGAALIFHAAAGSGQGVIEAAAEAGRYAIGVDSDQYAIFKASNPDRARTIVTSVLKRVDVAVLNALARHAQGRLAFGHSESLGLAEGGVSLADGSERMAGLSPSVAAALADLRTRIAAGAVTVPSAFARPTP